MGRAVTPHANELLPPEGYLSPEWYEMRRTTVSASEIAIVLDISPWGSPFDLWWGKHLGDPPSAETADMRRGRRLEGLILEDFQEAHPEFYLDRAGLCANGERPWQACTPDALAYETQPTQEHQPDPLAVVEAKSTNSREGWGRQGTDEIPPHYRAQVLWQMDTLGLEHAFVPVWIGTQYREYEVAYDADDVALMRAAAREFLDSLADHHMPPVDAHRATTQRLKRMYDFTDEDKTAMVPRSVVRQYHLAKRLRDTAQQRMDLAENRIRAAMGKARVGLLPDGAKAATRSVSHVPERTQTVAAHTRNTIRITPPKGSL